MKFRVRERLSGRAQTAWDVVRLAFKDLVNDNLDQLAAAVAFHGFLSIFPLLLLTIAVASSFVDASWAVAQLHGPMARVLPMSAEFVEQTVEGTYAARGSVGFFSLFALLWTGSRVFSALTVALNVAYDIDEPYGLFKRTGIQLLMTLTVGAFFVVAVASNFLLHRVASLLPLGEQGVRLTGSVISFFAPLVLLFSAFFLVYRFVPRGKQDWRAALVGAGVATLLFRIARPIFVHYVETFAGYELVYGSIVVVILLMLWAWLLALIVLLGAEVASHFQMLVLEGHDAEDVEARHRKRGESLGRARGPGPGDLRSPRPPT